MSINKITGFNFNSSVSFKGKNDSKDNRSKTIDIEKEKRMDEISYIMDYGKPSRVIFVYDKDYEFAVAKLFNKKDKCFYEAEVLDEQVDDCEDLLLRNGVEKKNIWRVSYGSLAYDTSENAEIEDFELHGLEQLGAEKRAAVKKALFELQVGPKETVHLRSAVSYNDNGEKYKMSYSDFILRTYGTDFEFYKVLDNLNASTMNSFTRKTIDTVIVTPCGTMMELRTKDGKRAFLDFNTGKRRVFESGFDSSGYGTIMLMDNYGPVIKKPEPESKEKELRKAVNQDESLSSRLLGYFGIGKPAGKHFKK